MSTNTDGPQKQNWFNQNDRSESDAYLSLMLSEYLDNQAVLPIVPESPIVEEPQKLAVAEQVQLTELIWVPANKHPQIAPGEFVNWINTHPTNPARRTSEIKRRNSSLSQSHVSEDEDNLSVKTSRSRSAKSTHSPSTKQKDSQQKTFKDDTMETIQEIEKDANNQLDFMDTMPVVPKESKSLLRRSAFSARGKTRKEALERERKDPRRTMSQRRPSDKEIPPMTDEGISLYDRPVCMSEWVDLGNATFSDDSQLGILSRVHDAETQVFSQLMDESFQEEEEQQQPEKHTIEVEEELSSKIEVEEEQPLPQKLIEKPRPTISEATIKRPTIDRVKSKHEKKPSWLSGLFNDKEKKVRSSTRRVEDEQVSRLLEERRLEERRLENKRLEERRAAEKRLEERRLEEKRLEEKRYSAQATKKQSGLASLFGRSLSIKPKAEPKFVEPKKKKRINQQDIIPPQFINSYRLPLHVERAVYRLSHYKLENPHRPLRHQVLISNFMFWYLSIINQHDNFAQAPQQQYVSNSPHQDDYSSQFHKKGKMSRFIISAKKRKDGPKTLLKDKWEDKSRPPAPQHAQDNHSSDEEDNVPLSYYKQ
ncbi:hypothetical protein PHYBLDRAFT_76156 [Phycomyces blakesleeanus NRRL 1555(-)]|uniref:Protein Zds1 C-terminal domain-containing protein n=1 Tax=Phycomyces blakesleeanus (strain ATCC 8743b / DSM 1359 / FGSC 10004 / NBRC 33097 / NRRL 1555) TaxID=763407 RepID=A0A162NJ17_PHYB8|nr:hypothetical protein PHYBLDRAFT_76156 [Phycomyces blakesleeanus NRRL 1555(-)]OAD70124.1 hypothetical protein PHYBLDRAFT_76156 [Phycomyces blakesleeanus NRRL 1555(-)]|eukprot:XP_018288164.1 hypothetical protein PHYBLDRAFT_76156 [Phycomyces blakesleeanus NRRL 1555(-)]